MSQTDVVDPRVPEHSVPVGDLGIAGSVAALRSVFKRFGSTQALDDVSLTVRPGEAHALLGRNGAGKSTAVSVLTGLVEPDAGEVWFDGSPAPTDGGARNHYVSCLYQHSTLVPSMSVAENLFINEFSTQGRAFVSRRRMRVRAEELMAGWDIRVDPDRSVEDLRFEERQFVEIARSLSQGARFIILDEPTAQLDSRQIQRLFDAVTRFQKEGIAFLFISHFLGEIFEICDTATVMRDGRTVLSAPVAALSESQIVAAMVGERRVDEAYFQRSPSFREDETPTVVVTDFAVADIVQPSSFEIRAGEILGIAGSTRSGASQIGEALAGLIRPDSGTVTMAGGQIELGDVKTCIDSGIGYVPRDRHVDGYVGLLGVDENLTTSVWPSLGVGGFVSPKRRAHTADRLIDQFEIKVSDRTDEVAGLSGGNQQKVVVGRAMASRPTLLILDSPTAGVDIASTAALFRAVDEAAKQGVAVLVISNVIPELRVCDRVISMFDGAFTDSFPAGWETSDVVAAIEGVGTNGHN